MNRIILAVATLLSLTTGAAAFAQPGAIAASHPGYWTDTSSDQSSYPQTHFLGQGTVFARIFGHSNSDRVADKPAAKSANGGQYP